MALVSENLFWNLFVFMIMSWLTITRTFVFCVYTCSSTCVHDLSLLLNSLSPTLGIKSKVVEAGLIANLRPLFCLVPLGEITRSPYSTRADYLCRFEVRADKNFSAQLLICQMWQTNSCVHNSVNVEPFLGIVLPNFRLYCYSFHFIALGIDTRICLRIQITIKTSIQ